MVESTSSLAALKRRIASIEGRKAAREERSFPLGAPAIDASLGGGLGYGRLHEIFADEAEDGWCAAGFALMLAIRASQAAKPLLWLRQEVGEAQGGRLYAPGLAEIGIDPARLILGIAADAAALLKAASDALRCAGLGAVLIEPWQRRNAVDLTASRRLALAAEQSGVTALLLQAGVAPVPSAARTRWRVRAAESAPLPANAPGAPAFNLELLRHRGGPDGLAWRVEWDRDTCSFRETPFSGALLPLPSGRPAEAGQNAA
jgi:protein ImuA